MRRAPAGAAHRCCRYYRYRCPAFTLLMAAAAAAMLVARVQSSALVTVNPWLSACDLVQPSTTDDLQGACSTVGVPSGRARCLPSCEGNDDGDMVAYTAVALAAPIGTRDRGGSSSAVAVETAVQQHHRRRRRRRQHDGSTVAGTATATATATAAAAATGTMVRRGVDGGGGGGGGGPGSGSGGGARDARAATTSSNATRATADVEEDEYEEQQQQQLQQMQQQQQQGTRTVTNKSTTTTNQCLYYLDESHKEAVCADGQDGQGGEGKGRLDDEGAARRRLARLRVLKLRHCCEHGAVESLGPVALQAVLSGGAPCRHHLAALLETDALAARISCEFTEVLTRYDCAQPYSIVYNCDDCKEAYRRWVCSSLVPHLTESGGRVRPCRSVCQTVEQRCPYMLPGDRAPAHPTQYAGEPTFLCLDPNIPETGMQRTRSSHGDGDCCYTYCGTPGRPCPRCPRGATNATWPPTSCPAPVGSSAAAAPRCRMPGGGGVPILMTSSSASSPSSSSPCVAAAVISSFLLLLCNVCWTTWTLHQLLDPLLMCVRCVRTNRAAPLRHAKTKCSSRSSS